MICHEVCKLPGFSSCIAWLVQAVEERVTASAPPSQRVAVMSRASSLSRAGSAAAPAWQPRPEASPAAEAASADAAGPAADAASPDEVTSTSSSAESTVSQEELAEPLKAFSGIDAERQHSADTADVSAHAAEVRIAGWSHVMLRSANMPRQQYWHIAAKCNGCFCYPSLFCKCVDLAP